MIGFHFPAVGEKFPGTNRVRCCEEDGGGSHYHCARCGKVTGMYGCYVGPVKGKTAEWLGVPVGFQGFLCEWREQHT